MAGNIARGVHSFIQDENGATSLEYGLLAALITAVIMAAVQTLGNVLGTSFNNVAASLKAATGS